jgi:hypothetical protein
MRKYVSTFGRLAALKLSGAVAAVFISRDNSI